MYYVYILQSLNKSELYVGSSNNLKERFKQHNLGRVFSTKRYLPWKIVYYEAYLEEKFARLRERRLKNHGNAMLELKKRIGLLKSQKGIYPAPLLPNINNLDSKIVTPIKTITKTQSVKSGAGFTLIEVLVVMGIAAILAGMGLVFSLDFYKSYAFNSERDLVVGLIQKARARSMSNINQKSYGVCVTPNNYILFSGTCNCDPGNSLNEVYPAHPSIANTNLAVSFEQLRGKPTFYTKNSSDNTCNSGGVNFVTLLVYGTAGPATISINPEGQIAW